jgi:hypothetical protein
VVQENPSEGEKILPNGRKPVSSIDSVADEMQARVRRLAFPGEPGESIKSVLGRVARRSGVTFNEAKRLWYREWRRVPADIADRIREAQDRHEHQIAREIEAQKARYWALTHMSSDTEFYGPRALEAHGPLDGSD